MVMQLINILSMMVTIHINYTVLPSCDCNEVSFQKKNCADSDKGRIRTAARVLSLWIVTYICITLFSCSCTNATTNRICSYTHASFRAFNMKLLQLNTYNIFRDSLDQHQNNVQQFTSYPKLNMFLINSQGIAFAELPLVHTGSSGHLFY